MGALQQAWLILKAGAPPPDWTLPENQSTQGRWGHKSLYGNQKEPEGAGEYDRGWNTEGTQERGDVQIETTPGLDVMADNVTAEKHEGISAQAEGALEGMEKEPGFLANLTGGGRNRIRDWKAKQAELENTRDKANERAAWLRDARRNEVFNRDGGTGFHGERDDATVLGMKERGLTAMSNQGYGRAARLGDTRARRKGYGRAARLGDTRARRKIEVMPREQELDVWDNPEPTFREDHPTQEELDWAAKEKQMAMGAVGGSRNSSGTQDEYGTWQQ